jgi:hypothetical protein
MNRTNERFANYDCIKLENESLQLWVTHDVGPRIIGLQLPGGDNLLAVLPNIGVTTPAGNSYKFRGGHRLWYAPEDVERTYLPDDTAVSITDTPNGIQTAQAVEPGTGIEKQMTITLPDETACVVIDHTLTNRGSESIELAPWAITQLKTGGFAILPQTIQDTGLLPNRSLVLWPYTRINSPHIQLGDEFIFVHASMKNEKLKLGWVNLDGWMAYSIDNTLFVKHATYQDHALYHDFGSSRECYCDDRFIELETLGPHKTLTPDESVTHREIWRLYPDVNLTGEESTDEEKFPSPTLLTDSLRKILSNGSGIRIR